MPCGVEGELVTPSVGTPDGNSDGSWVGGSVGCPLGPWDGSVAPSSANVISDTTFLVSVADTTAP